MKPVQKQMCRLLDRLAALPDPRAERWVLSRRDIGLIGRWSVSMHENGDTALPGYERHVEELMHGIDHHFCRIEREHEHAGLAWLWSQWNRGWLGTAELAVMKQFSHFTFAGVSVKQNGARWHATPLYTVHGTGGINRGMFTYESWSWQSGHRPRLVKTCFSTTAGG